MSLVKNGKFRLAGKKAFLGENQEMEILIVDSLKAIYSGPKKSHAALSRYRGKNPEYEYVRLSYGVEQIDNYLKDANAIVKWIVNKQTGKIRKKIEGIYDMSDDEAMATSIFGRYVKVYYLKEWGSKPATDYLKDLFKPILVMQGDADFHVSVETDFEKYKEILTKHENASFKLYPNLNHLFMPTVYGDIKKAKKEYRKAQKIEEYVINDIADWVKALG